MRIRSQARAWDRSFFGGVAVAQNPRIEELRRKLEREPNSPLFAQYAEELRRSGELAEAIRVCRDGLARHANYATGRVALARALAESGDASGARAEFEAVLRSAPDNVSARRGLEELPARAVSAAEATHQEGTGGLRGAEAVPPGGAVAAPPAASASAPPLVAVAAARVEFAASAEAGGTSEGRAVGADTTIDGVASAAGAEAAGVAGPPSGDDEEYELESLRPAAPAGPPQLTFRPLLEEEEQRESVAGGGSVTVAITPQAVSAMPADAEISGSVAGAPKGTKPASVELASATLAELYLEQGSLERAAAIYEELLVREPANARLRERLDGVRSRIAAGGGTREDRVRRVIARLDDLRGALVAGRQRGHGGGDA
jgi:tetratricopeptide (TPR) repeat protein